MSNLELFKSFASKKDDQIQVGNNAVIYTRVSHHSQEDNTSLESQKKYCEKFAERRGLNVVEYFGGTYESAKTDDRKEFNRMLSYVKRSKNITYVVVYSYERFSRSGINGASIADDLLKKYKVITLAVTQELDPTTPSGSFQQKILFLFGQMDNEMRRDKTVTGMKELLAKGYYLHAIPKGYTNLNKGEKAVNQKIVVNKEGILIRKAFMWKAENNLSVAAISRKLAKLGLDLNERRLLEIFKNPFYCGLIVSKMLPGQVVQGHHEPMVDQKLFLKINNINSEKRNHPETHNLNDDNMPLKRFMKCGVCDTPMTGFLVKKKGLYYYRCRKKGCKNVKSAKALHEDFSAIMSAFKIDDTYMDEVKEAVKIVLDTVFEEQYENKKLLERKLNEVTNNIESIDERYAIGKINDELYSKFNTKYTTQKANLVKDLDDLTKMSSNLKKIINYTVKVCLKPLLLWKSSRMMDKATLQLFIFPQGIIYNRDKGRVQTFEVNSFFSVIPEVARLVAKMKNGNSLSLEQIAALVRNSQ